MRVKIGGIKVGQIGYLWIRGWYINAPEEPRGVVKRVVKRGQNDQF